MTSEALLLKETASVKGWFTCTTFPVQNITFKLSGLPVFKSFSKCSGVESRCALCREQVSCPWCFPFFTLRIVLVKLSSVSFYSFSFIFSMYIDLL